ncbi:MAG: 50S ribosomal protein L21 [Alphaproteobacteria bacterium]
MFAVIRSGGKQYKVASGDTIRVDRLQGNAGDKVEFGEVLVAGSNVGAPLVSGAKVLAEVVRQFRDEKVIVFKKKRRQNYRRKNGHRQYLTEVKITGFEGVKEK